MKEKIEAILAGVFISLAGYVYLSTERSWIGAVLFAFGLMTVVASQYKLYTGVVGFSKNIKFISKVLLFNVIGCAATAAVLSCTNNGLTLDNVHAIIDGRLAAFDEFSGLFKTLVNGIGCGIIMSVIVNFGKKCRDWILLIFGIAVFIISGFYHSIADAFYVSYDMINSSYDIYTILMILMQWIVVVIGNAIGCNIHLYDRMNK